jgi:alpha-ketoglutarate-dependent taurine dioxygenase
MISFDEYRFLQCSHLFLPFPFSQLWKNPETGALHFQVHPSAIREIIIEPIPSSSKQSSNALYPQGAHLKEIKEVRDLVYNLQRPSIAPAKVYAHDWEEDDLALFHNQGVTHSVCGAFGDDEVRIFHQCNLAASTEPLPPTSEDIQKYA